MTSHHRITTIACVFFTGLAATTAAAGDDPRTAQVDLKIIQVNPQMPAGARMISAWNAAVRRLREPAEGGTAPAAGETAPDRTASEKDVTFDVLACDADKLFEQVLADKQAPAAGTLITAPRLIAHIDEESSVEIGRQVPYMVKRDDGSLTVEQSDDLLEGVIAKVKVSAISPPESGASLTCQVDLYVKISSVTCRQPIAGVPFDVGRPIIASRETESTLRIASGTDVVIRLPQPDQDDEPIFVVVAVKIIEDPAA
jgi:hypothetical protein